MAEGTEVKRTDDDMIIIIADEIRKGSPSTIDMAQWDTDLDLPAGSTARLLEQAAADAYYEITRRGSTHASLARRQGRIIRG